MEHLKSFTRDVPLLLSECLDPALEEVVETLGFVVQDMVT
jgi:hypothetical protein